MSGTAIGIELLVAKRSSYASLDLRETVLEGWTFSHIVHGEVRTATAGVAQMARTGMVMVHPPRVPFDETASGSGTHEFMTFRLIDSDRSVVADDALHRLSMGLAFALDKPEEWSARFRRLERLVRSDRPEAKLLIAAAALDVVSATIESWTLAGRPLCEARIYGNRGRFAKVVEFMELRLASPLTRTELAEQACMHPSAFDRAFRSEFGLPPMAMLRELRLRNAERLLLDTDVPLLQIASQCGFGDAPHLVRLFRAYRGLTPGAFRESARRARAGYVTTTPPE